MIRQSLKMALKAITANKMRSFLTMLGIIIGVYSLVTLVTLVDGATSSVTDAISDLGHDYLIGDVGTKTGTVFDDQNIAEMREIDGVLDVIPEQIVPVTIVANKMEKKATCYAVTSGFFPLEGLTAYTGRILTSVDDDNHLNVVVLSYETAKKIYGRYDIEGEIVKINGVNYTIVGVLNNTEGGLQQLYSGDDYTVYIPLSTYTRQPEVTFKGYTEFLFSAESGESIETARDGIYNYFYKELQDSDDFDIMSQSELNSVLDNVTGALSILFGGIAAISLLVGGIGIMNIMLVSVTERTKEIGIRKAIGADRASIMLQFLIEAFAISLTGCIIALLLSYLTIALVNLIVSSSGMDIEMHFSIPLNIIMTSVFFSLGVGLIFGIYPANKAAKKKPIEALHYDG